MKFGLYGSRLSPEYSCLKGNWLFPRPLTLIFSSLLLASCLVFSVLVLLTLGGGLGNKPVSLYQSVAFPYQGLAMIDIRGNRPELCSRKRWAQLVQGSNSDPELLRIPFQKKVAPRKRSFHLPIHPPTPCCLRGVAQPHPSNA